MIKKFDAETIFLDILCDDTKNAIDVGANKGVYIELILPHCKHLYAYEPLPQMARQLKRKYGKKRNITISAVALSDKEGYATLFTPRYTNPEVDRDSFVEGWSSIYKDYQQLQKKYPDKFPEIRKARVKTSVLDKEKLSNIGFIKIDVEGAELEVLEGARSLLLRDRPNLLIEIEERHRRGSIAKVGHYLKRLRYNGYFLLNKKLYPLSQFSITKMQRGKILPGPIDPKYKHYVYNFIFVPSENRNIVKRLRKRILK